MPLPSWYAPLLSDSVVPNHRQTSFHNITHTRGPSLHHKSRALLGKSGNLQAKLNIQTIGRLPWYSRHPLLSNAAIFKRSSSKYRHRSFNYINVKLEITTENVSVQFKWCSVIFALDLPHCMPLFFEKKSWSWLILRIWSLYKWSMTTPTHDSKWTQQQQGQLHQHPTAHKTYTRKRGTV